MEGGRKGVGDGKAIRDEISLSSLGSAVNLDNARSDPTVCSRSTHPPLVAMRVEFSAVGLGCVAEICFIETHSLSQVVNSSPTSFATVIGDVLSVGLTS